MQYTITVFSDRGETLLDDVFEAESDGQAREEGIHRLSASEYAHHAARVTRSGRLIHFERAYLPRIVPASS